MPYSVVKPSGQSGPFAPIPRKRDMAHAEILEQFRGVIGGTIVDDQKVAVTYVHSHTLDQLGQVASGIVCRYYNQHTIYIKIRHLRFILSVTVGKQKKIGRSEPI